MTIANNFQPFIIAVKISEEFLTPHMTNEDKY